MKRFISFFGIILYIAGFFFCASFPASGQSGSSVWRISRNGSTLFLGGSIHVLRADDFPPPQEFDRAFAQSSMLILEADIEELANEKIVQYLMANMFLPNYKTLESVLDSPTYEMLRAKCKEFALAIESFSRFKPSMIINILTMLEIQKFGFAESGIDAYYFAMAKQAGKRLGFLETVEAQIDMLVNMGDGYENDFVRYSLADMENTEEEIVTLVSEWRNGRTGHFESAISEMRETWPVLYQTMLCNRNAAWLPQIEEYLTGGQSVFVIVGLAHLHGPDGLLRMLEQSGCAVEQFRLTL